jgi:hypothetical protein
MHIIRTVVNKQWDHISTVLPQRRVSINCDIILLVVVNIMEAGLPDALKYVRWHTFLLALNRNYILYFG